MMNLTPEQRRNRAAAHAAAARSNSTLWPNWPHPVPKKLRKPKAVFSGKTPRYKVARAFKAGHGRRS